KLIFSESGNRLIAGVKEILRVKLGIPEEFKSAAMYLVGSCSRNRVHDATDATAELRAVVVFQNGKLSDGFHSQQLTRHAARNIVVPQAVDLGPIQKVHRLVGPRAIDRDLRSQRDKRLSASFNIGPGMKAVDHPALNRPPLAVPPPLF